MTPATPAFFAPESDRHAAPKLDRATQLFQEGRLGESEAAFQELVASGEHQAEAYYALGVISVNRSDLPAASAYLNQALETNPQNDNAHYYLGVIAEKSATIDEALPHYYQALAANPHHVGAGEAVRRLESREGTVATVDENFAAAYGVYEFLLRDESSISKQTVALIDELQRSVRPRVIAYFGRRPVRNLLSLVLLFGFVNLLRVMTTNITLARGRLQIERGILSRRLISLELWRVRNLELDRSLFNRMTGDGTLVFTAFPEAVPGHGGRRELRKTANLSHLEVSGFAHGDDLKTTFQKLLNLTFLLRANPVVKGIIQ